MQPSSREMNQQLLTNHLKIQPSNFFDHRMSHFDPSSSPADFLEQMLSTISSSTWPDLNPVINSVITGGSSKLGDLSDETSQQNPEHGGYSYDESANLESRLQSYHFIGSSPGAKATAMMLQQHFLMSRGVAGDGDGISSGFLPMPLSMHPPQVDVADGLCTFKPHNPGVDQALYNGLSAQTLNHPQHFIPPQPQNHGASGSAINQVPAGGSTGATAAQPRQRLRARRGQATDPHSIAERLRRERIAERMKSLQELVPNANKTDKASMLDEIIDYVKFLQLQVKVLSMSRLGSVAAVAPLVPDISSQGRDGCVLAGGNGGAPGRPGGVQTTSTNDSVTATEQQVAKMMEEDMGSAMQYLQGKGLCLMPISLATAISTSTCNLKNSLIGGRTAIPSYLEGPSSPNMSAALSVQSSALVNGVGELTVKDAPPLSKP